MDRKAFSMPDVSFPPASAKSGLPPPEPPTSLASSWTIFPAWSLGIRSFVTAVIRATLPSSAEAKTTTPEPSFWRRESTIWRRASRSKPFTLRRQHPDALDVLRLAQEVPGLGACRLALEAFKLPLKGLYGVNLALDGLDQRHLPRYSAAQRRSAGCSARAGNRPGRGRRKWPRSGGRPRRPTARP